MPKVIGIIGSRKRNTPEDFLLVQAAFLGIYEPGDRICSGGCRAGGDAFAEILAQQHGINPIIHLPDKSKLDPVLVKKNPRAAWAGINYERNKLIARDSDVLIACVAKGRTGGTENTIKHFKRMGKENNLILV